MRGWKVSVALFVVMSFFVPPAVLASAGGSETSADSTGRGDYVQKTAQDVELKLASGTYANSTFNISLPSGATVTSASVDLEGKPVVGPTQSITCDFASDPGSMYTAYAGGHTKNTPDNAKPSSFLGNQFQGADLSKISYSDNSYTYVYFAAYYNNEWGYHHFQFKVPLDITSKVSVTYEGWGGYPYGYYGIGTIAAYLWNNVSLTWELVGSGSESPKSVLSKDFSGQGYVREQGGQHYVDVLAICQVGTPSTYSYNCVNTDYVKVVVEGNALSYPKNPKMFVGTSPNSVWNMQTDLFNYQVSVGDVQIMNALQTLAQRTTTQFADIKLKFTSDTPCKMRVSNFTVSYKSPPWCKIIPDTYTIYEDTPTPRLVNLNDYFVDDIVGTKLNFEIIYEQDAKKLDADIDNEGWMGFKTPTKNWWGAFRFKVRATDSDSLTRDSNNFTVTVLPVNDPPAITSIGRQIATQGILYTLTVRVKDVDMELDPLEETVVFSDNTTLFEIDPTTGKLSFTPTQEQVGIYNIGIIATDLAGDMDQENFTLEVQDAEDPPLLDEIPDQSATQDAPFTYTVSAIDPDLPYGDALTFSDNSPLFAIEAATGAISFTPAVKDIGSYRITVTVNDARGGTDSKQFTLTVLNSMGTLNRPPSIEPIANLTAQEGTLFEYTVKGSDPDLDQGDSISFQDNCPIFDITSGTGKISFKPTAKDAGVYNVKMTVKDREGLTATTEFRLTVIKTNHAPNVTGVLPRDGTKVLVNRQFKLSASASDVDGDKLNYTWKDGDTVLGYGANITATYPDAGTYIITLIVSDGKLEKANETTIEVVEKSTGGGSSSTPGFEAVLAAAAVAIAALGLAQRKRVSR